MRADPPKARGSAPSPSSKFGSPGGLPLVRVEGAKLSRLRRKIGTLAAFAARNAPHLARQSLRRQKWLVLLVGFLVLLHAIGYGVALGIAHIRFAERISCWAAHCLAVCWRTDAVTGGAAGDGAARRPDGSLLAALHAGADTPHSRRASAGGGRFGLALLLLILVPLADGMLFLGRTDLLGIFPMFVVLSLLVTSCGFAVTFLLLRLTACGARVAWPTVLPP